MAKYLDDNGLLYFWQKIKLLLASKVDTVSGKGLSTEDYTTAEQTKLAGIEAGAEVNQNAFSNVKVGSTTVSAGAKTDTLELDNGTYISLTPDTTNKKVVIATTFGLASTSANGLLSSTDKKKIDGSQGLYYGTCSTAASTAAKVVSCTNFVLSNGTAIIVNFSNKVYATDTLNINNTGAKSMRPSKDNASDSSTMMNLNSGVHMFIYDGTCYRLVDYDQHVTYTAGDNVFISGGVISASDTKNTAGSTDSSSKLFIIGATSQANYLQTYSQDTAYVGTDGHLYSDSKQVVNLSGSQALTNKTYNGYTLGSACEKSSANSVSSGGTGLPTAGAVYTFVTDAISGAQVGASTFKGTVSAGTDISGLSSYSKGWYWVVQTAGTYVGEACEAGDMIFCIADRGSSYSANDFSVVQNNLITITNAEIDTILAS